MIDGNFSVKDAASKCLAIIFKYQHHVPARDDLLEFIMKKLAISKNFSHRRAFIWFCKHLVSLIPFQMFRDIFSETFIEASYANLLLEPVRKLSNLLFGSILLY